MYPAFLWGLKLMRGGLLLMGGAYIFLGASYYIKFGRLVTILLVEYWEGY